MAPATNWLSFSLSPFEMLRSSESQFMAYNESSSNPSSQYLIDNFYGNGWSNPKSQLLLGEENPGKVSQTQSIGDSYIDSQNQTHPIPKLEDFLGDSSCMVRYSDSQTETQDSSLTHIYDASYFGDQNQDLKAVAAFQAFSTNSGSELDDSASIARTQLTCTELGQSIESSGNEVLAFSSCPTGSLSLGVSPSAEEAIVAVDSDCSKKVVDTFGQRTSIYRGVTRHRWTGRYEAHLWDNSCRREGQARKGRQVYLGGYDKEDKAARAYDLAALKYWGPTATTNFPVSCYSQELEDMKHVTKQEFIASLRRKSSGFSRGASRFRGVTRHHQQGRWQARIGRVAGNKDLYLGTFATEEEAAEAYDIAAIKFRGLNAVTNFEMNRYDVETIAKSSLPVGGTAKRLKLSLEAEEKPSVNHDQQIQCSSSNINFSALQPNATFPSGIQYDAATAALYHHNIFHHLPPNYHSSSAGGSAPANSAPMPGMSQPTEFFIWPNQSY